MRPKSQGCFHWGQCVCPSEKPHWISS